MALNPSEIEERTLRRKGVVNLRQPGELEALLDRVRADLLETVAETGGHIGVLDVQLRILRPMTRERQGSGTP